MIDVTQAHRILFVRTDRLGETVLNLPAVAVLRRAFPRASLTFLAHPDLQPLLSQVPEIDDVMPYPPGPRGSWWLRACRMGGRLRARRFDVALISNPQKELHAAVWLAGIPYRVGYARKWGWLLTHRLPDRKALGERHEVEYNLDLIRALGFPTGAPEWPLPDVSSERKDIDQLLARQGISCSDQVVVIHPGTSNPLKRWPTDRFAELIRRVAGHLPVRLVLIGGAEEQEQAQWLLAHAPSVANVVGQLSLSQLAALCQRARLLISNDSGPVHVAAAVGTKTLVLFGTSDAASGPARWGPWGTGHAVIWKPTMEAIEVDEVWQAVEPYLEP